MKKLLTTFKVLAVFAVLSLNSCQDENRDNFQENVSTTSAADLKRELTPSSQSIPDAVQNQLNDTRKNLETQLKNDLQITKITVLGKINSPKGISVSQDIVSDKAGTIAYGNIMDVSSVKIGKMENLYSGEDLSAAQKGLKEAIAQEVKTGTEVMEITWSYKGGSFTSLCFYNNTGIIWDNIMGGLIMMDTRSINEESSDSTNAKVASKWYKQWWTANWLWGSKRGEIGYKITIYYSGSTVSNVDVSDWGNISLGKAKSESKVIKKTGAYGQCRYALGLCTPVGSLSFNSTNFSVSFSGLGSNIVSNGTKSLYP